MNCEEIKELKPCPFCGGTPFIHSTALQILRGDHIETYWEITCPCGVHTGGYRSEYRFLDSEQLIPEGLMDGRKKAIEAWNRRERSNSGFTVSTIE